MERLLKELTEVPGPSGHEEFIKEAIARNIRPHCDRLWEDPLGNLIARTGPESGYRLGILAHMDEVGLIVTRLSDRGLIGLEMIGTIDVRLLPGREVDIIRNDGTLLRGVIGNLSRHLQTAEDLAAPVSIKQLFIDTGFRSREDLVKEGVDIGSEIVFATPFHQWPNGTVLAKALDNRISCVVLIKTLEALHGRLNQVGVYGMFTVQEEIGAKGAGVVAFDIRPNLTITLDNVPTKNPDQVSSGDVDLGRGPVIRIFDWHPATKLGMFTHPKIKHRLLEVGQRETIPHQKDVVASTFLDSSTAHLTAGGIPGASICFPRRYSHSPVEMSHLSDMENGVKLLVSFVRSLEEDPLQFGKTYGVEK
jgi:endoglucanase